MITMTSARMLPKTVEPKINLKLMCIHKNHAKAFGQIKNSREGNFVMPKPSAKNPTIEKTKRELKSELKKLSADVKAGRVQIEVLNSIEFVRAVDEAYRNRLPGVY